MPQDVGSQVINYKKRNIYTIIFHLKVKKGTMKIKHRLKHHHAGALLPPEKHLTYIGFDLRLPLEYNISFYLGDTLSLVAAWHEERTREQPWSPVTSEVRHIFYPMLPYSEDFYWSIQ